MSSEMEALDKAKEAAEAARERKHLAPISLTISILAVLIATVSLLGHRTHTKEILLVNQATDQWAYYQAKNMQLNNLEALSEVLTALENTKAERAEKVQKRFHDDIDKLLVHKKDIQNKAYGLEAEFRLASRRADRYDLGQVFLEIALVVTSITLLTDKRAYWYFGLVLATVGIVAAGSRFMVH
jgi:hypothetical protein